MTCALLACIAVTISSAAPRVTTYSEVTSSGPVGSLTITETGNSVDGVWRIDDNGRARRSRSTSS